MKAPRPSCVHQPAVHERVRKYRLRGADVPLELCLMMLVAAAPGLELDHRNRAIRANDEAVDRAADDLAALRQSQRERHLVQALSRAERLHDFGLTANTVPGADGARDERLEIAANRAFLRTDQVHRDRGG